MVVLSFMQAKHLTVVTIKLFEATETSIISIFITILVAATPILKVHLRAEFLQISLGISVPQPLSLLIYILCIAQIQIMTAYSIFFQKLCFNT